MQLILASSSKYRRRLLRNAGLEVLSHSPDTDESPLPSESCRTLSRRLSEQKARAVSKHYPGSLIIGSDQTAAIGSILIGKPGDHQTAFSQLSRASGKSMKLFASVALLNTVTDTVQCHTETVRVRFRILTDQQIDQYLLDDKPYDCCGSLKVESSGIRLLKSVESNDPNAIIGLPLIALVSMLHAENYPL
ncbi:MAG: Maf family nucleotide pyrophosphatase [Pseudomonadota bacterium]